MNTRLAMAIVSGLAALAPTLALAAAPREKFLVPDPTEVPAAYLCLGIFLFSYLFVMTEEKTHLRKSKPVILAAGVIWGMIAFAYAGNGDGHSVEAAVGHNLLEFSELFLFLLAAMTYVNAMDERRVFEALRGARRPIILAGNGAIRRRASARPAAPC